MAKRSIAILAWLVIICLVIAGAKRFVAVSDVSFAAQGLTVDLVERHRLYNTSSIVIVPTKRSKIGGDIREITDPAIIKIILKELKCMKPLPVFRDWVQYMLKFYDRGMLLDEFGYNPQVNFFRHKYGFKHDYCPSRQLNTLLNI
ncbi:hypothetical protein OAA99_02170 [Omnitrophica bacterium]|nr:hypothetical protein [Candidatus Omnitrophota bacterium]